uniref:Uncharacterized protein n=1 Tax=Oryza meridionalis TaxID=40149 RepID=A0A0E0DAG2_9ORYZ
MSRIILINEWAKNSENNQLCQNSQVCKIYQERRPPAEDGLDWAGPWFGRTSGFDRTLPGTIGCRVSSKRRGSLPNDGWMAIPTIPTATTVIGSLFK